MKAAVFHAGSFLSSVLLFHCPEDLPEDEARLSVSAYLCADDKWCERSIALGDCGGSDIGMRI